MVETVDKDMEALVDIGIEEEIAEPVKIKKRKASQVEGETNSEKKNESRKRKEAKIPAVVAEEIIVEKKENEAIKKVAETRREKIQETIEKNARTIFVGNLPVTVIEKAETKQLKDHFATFGALESIRFRSIAFSDKLPRKQAFLSKKLHEGRDSLNAYIVFKDVASTEPALTANGTLFLGRHIRVDHSEKKAEKKRDTKRCVFVGNLAFDISEEALWQFFADAGDIENVRVIRDQKTNVGKGFGYVQFKERSTVLLALKTDGGLLAGRKCRVTKATEKLAQVNKKPVGTNPKIIEGTRASRDISIKTTKPKKPRTVKR